MPRLWVYKCNANDEDNHGDWDYFFDNRKGKGTWGGTWCIHNAASLRFIREEMAPGDLVLAWQTDRRAALGLCRVKELKRNGEDIEIVLETVKRFAFPVKILKWKKTIGALANGKAFVPAKMGTIFDTTSEEAEEILRICGVEESLT